MTLSRRQRLGIFLMIDIYIKKTKKNMRAQISKIKNVEMIY